MNEDDLLVEIFRLNYLDTDTVRLNASTIKQLFEDTNYTLNDVREKKLVKMPRARTHEENRRVCCAGCGIRGAKLVVTKTIEVLLKKYSLVNTKCQWTHFHVVFVTPASRICISVGSRNRKGSL